MIMRSIQVQYIDRHEDFGYFEGLELDLTVKDTNKVIPRDFGKAT